MVSRPGPTRSGASTTTASGARPTTRSRQDVTGVAVANFGLALVVNRTRDGGRSFETLRTGLPRDHRYELIYRHGAVRFG